MTGGALAEGAEGLDCPSPAGGVFVVAPWDGITGTFELASCS